MGKISFLLIALFITFAAAFGQKTADSLLDQLSQEKDEVKRAKIMNSLAYFYDNNDENKNAYDFASKALTIAQKYNNIELLYDLYYVLGSIQFDLGNYEASLENFNKCLVANKEYRDSSKYHVILFNVGMLYWEIKEYDKALEFVQQSVHLHLDEEDSFNRTIDYLTIGSIYSDIGHDSAIYYMNLALESAKKNEYHNLCATTHNNLGDHYIKLKDFKNAIEHFNIAINQYSKDLDPSLEAILYVNLAEAYARSKNMGKAQDYLNIAFTKTKDSTLLNECIYCYQVQYLIDSLNYNFKSALANYQLYKEKFDSVSSIDFKTQAANFEAIYQLQQNSNKISQLEQENTIKNLQIRSQKLTIIYILSIGFLLVVLTIYVFISNRTKHKLNKILIELNSELEQSTKLLQEKNESLQESNKEKDKFLSIIAHDLKNPFQSLLGLTDLFYKDFRTISEEKKTKIAEMIHRSARKINSLLEDLLDWSRSQSNRIKYEPQELSLKEEVGTSVEYIRPMALGKNIQLINEIPDDHIVYADRHMIFTIVRNIISNSIKFSHPYSSIKLDSVIDGKFCKIMISDSGTGMDSDKLEKLFHLDSYHTSSGTGNEMGTGLGLAICKEFVAINKGQIGAESKKGEGSVFWFTLPIQKNM